LRCVKRCREDIAIVILQLVLRWRIAMRSVALLMALWALCGPANAQTSQCQSIPKASDRLACYDKATPPKNQAKSPAAGSPAAASPAASSPAASSKTSPQQGQLGDMLADENARLDSKIKTICRGC